MPCGRKSREYISESAQIKSSDTILEEIVRIFVRAISYEVVLLVYKSGYLFEMLALSFEICRWEAGGTAGGILGEPNLMRLTT